MSKTIEQWNANLSKGISEGNLTLVHTSLNHGADINAFATGNRIRRMTPLTMSIRYDQFAIFKVLISRGANINMTERYGTTPLILCIQKEKMEMARYLISVGANTCKPDRTGATPLSWAVRTQNIRTVDLLLDNGAQFTMHSCLLDAVSSNNLDIVRVLARRGASLDFEDGNGYTALIKSAESGALEITKELVQRGADIDRSDQINWKTPLVRSIEMGNFETARYLIEKGADVNLPGDRNGTTPLIKAIESGNLGFVLHLVAKGADVNKADRHQNFPIMKVVEMGNCDMLECLLRKGVKKDVHDAEGYGPFLRAVQKENLFMVKCLVQNGGVDVNQIRKKIVKKVQTAASDRKGKKSKNVEKNKQNGIMKEQEDAVNKHNPVLQTSWFENEKTALSIALSNHDWQTFKFLIECKAKLNEGMKREIHEMKQKDRNFAVWLDAYDF